MMTLDEALMMCADNMRTTIDAEGFACAEDFALVCLAAEVRRLREENERLKSNQTQLLSSWQPIATAPKDGTDILVMTGETMHVVRWENVHGDFDYWVVDDNKHGPFTLRGKEPTHWMPLPEPAP
jgi:hypothetical protein